MLLQSKEKKSDIKLSVYGEINGREQMHSITYPLLCDLIFRRLKNGGLAS